jgi:hypothetical protein
MFSEYRAPATPPNLRLWRAGSEKGLLAEYDEWSAKRIRHRAYWIPTQPNAGTTPGKPAFVSPKVSVGLQSIPVVQPPVSPDFVPAGGFYAMLASDGLGFTLYWRASPEPGAARPSDEVVGNYKLPVYEENPKAWLSVLLTPPLLLLYAAVVLVIVGAYFYLNSHIE